MIKMLAGVVSIFVVVAMFCVGVVDGAVICEGFNKLDDLNKM